MTMMCYFFKIVECREGKYKIVEIGNVSFHIWSNCSQRDESKSISLKSGLQPDGCVHCAAGFSIDLFGES